MKKLVELLLCILHPLAVVLMWINLVSRTDLTTVGKLAWAIFGLIPLVPLLVRADRRRSLLSATPADAR